MLPRPVLEQARRDIVALPDVGISPLEISHRSTWFEDVIAEAERNLRQLLGIPDGHHVVFCQGGATAQFSMVALNLLRGSGRAASYVLTGSWSEKALAEGAKEGPAHVLWSGKASGYSRVPGTAELAPEPEAAYLHITSNETIQGVQWPAGSEPQAAALVCDASSDFLSRPVQVDRYGILYAGAQKNAGPAGVTVALVRDDILPRIPDGLPAILDYRTYTVHRSLYNTPPVFSIYVLLLVTRWLRDQVGGLERQHEINREKAGMLYAAIDASDGFYRGHAEPGSRSLMNVTFRLASEELEALFLKEAGAGGLVELKGHRSVGGVHASIYNAVPIEGVRALAAYMRDFANARG